MVKLFKRLLPLVLVLGAVMTSPKPAEAGSGVCVSSGSCLVVCTVTTSTGEVRTYPLKTCPG
jgi:hypothetical protein